MSQHYSTLAFTDHVVDSQIQYGSRAAIGRLHRHAGETPSRSAAAAVGEEEVDGVRDPLGSAEVDFIAEQDGFYMATTSESGWPYVQFRAGPPGFVRSLEGTRSLGRISVETASTSAPATSIMTPRVAMIFLDYAQQARLKIYGVAHVTDVRKMGGYTSPLAVPGYRARVERKVRVNVIAYDWNCPQHITPRFSTENIRRMTEASRRRVSDLEAENQALRARLGSLPTSSGPTR